MSIILFFFYIMLVWDGTLEPNDILLGIVGTISILEGLAYLLKGVGVFPLILGALIWVWIITPDAGEGPETHLVNTGQIVEKPTDPENTINYYSDLFHFNYMSDRVDYDPKNNPEDARFKDRSEWLKHHRTEAIKKDTINNERILSEREAFDRNSNNIFLTILACFFGIPILIGLYGAARNIMSPE